MGTPAYGWLGRQGGVYGWLANRGAPSGFSYTTPIFHTDYSDGSIVPTIGTAGTLNRASTERYMSAAYEMAEATTGNPAAPAFAFGNSSASVGGIQLCQATKNFCLYSEDTSNAVWADVNTPTITDNVGTFLAGSDPITYATVAGASGEGLEQDMGFGMGAGETWLWSAYAKVATGTLSVQMKIKDGSAFGATKNYTLDTDVQKIYVSFTAGGGASGNLVPEFTLQGSGTAQIGGFQLESILAAPGNQGTKAPSCYIKTTSATATTAIDDLSYPATDFAGVIESTGTIMFWWSPLWANTERGVINYMLSFTTELSIAVFTGNTYVVFYNGLSWTPTATSFSKDTWYHIGLTWVNNGVNDSDLEFYIDGSLHSSVTTFATGPINLSGISCLVGNKNPLTQSQGGQAVIQDIKVYDSVIGTTEFAQIYSDGESSHGK